MSRITFGSVHGNTVDGTFYDHVVAYFHHRQLNEAGRLADSLREAAGHIDDVGLAEKYLAIADQPMFQSDAMQVYSGPLLSMGRGLLCANFLDHSDTDWLVMCDTDQTFSHDAWEQMVWIAENSPEQPKLLGGIVWMVTLNQDGTIQKRQPNVFKRVRTADGEWLVPMDAEELAEPGLYRVGACGAAVMLIHRDLLIKVRDEACGGNAHWWHHLPSHLGAPTPEKKAQVAEAAEILGVEPGVLLADQFGEDTSFCQRVNAVGEGIYVHSQLSFGHAKKRVEYGPLHGQMVVEGASQDGSHQ